MFVILADPADLHGDAVLFYLKKAGAEVIRLHPASYTPESMPLTYQANDAGCDAALAVRGKSVSASHIRGVFCRDWTFPACDASASTAEHLAAAEIRTALQGFFHSAAQARWVNSPWREAKADNKLFQYRHAAAAGLAIPETLVTNDLDRLRLFYENHQGKIIIKQMSDICLVDEVPFRHADGRPDCNVYGFYTQRMTNGDINEAGSLATSPCLFQEAVPKKYELRVTIVGKRWFAHRIDSQSHPDAVTDWRRVPDLPVSEAIIPSGLGRKLTSLIQSWGLVFAACDLIETPDSGYVFLEANVCGNWLWLEAGEESPVAEQIASYLLHGC